jgi:hypothetical protein
MRRVLQFLFLVFYFASSYAISQERTALIVSELQHSSSRESATQLDAGCKQLHNSFPNFRQAKPKAGGDTSFAGAALVAFLPELCEQSFHLQIFPLKSRTTIERIPSRAPPLNG